MLSSLGNETLRGEGADSLDCICNFLLRKQKYIKYIIYIKVINKTVPFILANKARLVEIIMSLLVACTYFSQDKVKPWLGLTCKATR